MNGTNTGVGDDQAYWIARVNLINKTVSQVGLGFICILGNIGSAFICIVFSQPAFRSSPCAIYFIASSIAQFFTFNFALFTRMLEFGYNVQTINTVSAYCKIRYYLFYVFVAIPRYNTIWASIDRYFASSRDATVRQWSSPKIAYRVIIGTIIFWCLMYIQVLVCYDIYNGSCQFRSGAYGMFFSIYIAIDSGILPVSLMSTFGLLTIRNIHQTRQRITPIAGVVDSLPGRATGMSKKDVQLNKMLANQIVLFVILNILNPCWLLYRTITLNITKSPLRRTVELLINNGTYVLIYFGFALTCTNFLISSEMFRREFRQFIRIKILHQPAQPSTTGGTTVRMIRKTNVDDRTVQIENTL